MKDSIRDDRSVADRYRQYVFFRLLVVVLSFGLVAFHQVWADRVYHEYVFYYLHGILVAYLGFAIFSWLGFDRVKDARPKLFPLLIVDFIFQSMLVGLSGGVVSVFSPVLVVTLVATTSLVSVRHIYTFATGVALVLSATTVIHALDLFPGDVGRHSLAYGRQTFVLLLASVIGVYLVSTLGAKFSRGVRCLEGIHSEILENMDEGLIAVDTAQSVLHLNKKVRKLFDLKGREEGYVGRPLSEALAQRELREIVTCLSADRKQVFQMTLSREGHRERPLEVKTSTVKDEHGETRCRIALITDLTLEREIEVAEKKIQKLEDLQVMALGIAHEIRNPLASIRGCVQELRKLVADGERESRFMGIVCRESDRLDGILEDFMSYAQPDPVKLMATNLGDLVNEAVLLLRNREGFGNRQMEWVPPNFRTPILASRDHLIRVFLNLGVNSIQATDSDSGRVWVRVSESDSYRFRNDEGSEERRSGVQVEWGDNGHGVGPQDRSQLFTPFFSTKKKGCGLGLSIVARIVREHRGTIEVAESPLGTGTVFRIRFPVIHGLIHQERSNVIDRKREIPDTCHA